LADLGARLSSPVHASLGRTSHSHTMEQPSPAKRILSCHCHARSRLLGGSDKSHRVPQPRPGLSITPLRQLIHAGSHSKSVLTVSSGPCRSNARSEIREQTWLQRWAPLPGSISCVVWSRRESSHFSHRKVKAQNAASAGKRAWQMRARPHSATK
jgi:hypothetical protein